MKMMLARIVSPKFRKSVDRLAGQELPIRAMFQLKGIVRQIREETSKWDELQLELAKKWADKDEEGKPVMEKSDGKTSYYKMGHDGMLQFAAEMGELAKMEIDIPEVKISLLGDVKLTTDDLIELEFIVESEI
jgi:hypothetical protein